MRWLYKFIDHVGDIYRYAYSCEDDILDGIISYSSVTGEATVERASETDKGINRRIKKSLEHFYTVVEENFPEQRYICTG